MMTTRPRPPTRPTIVRTGAMAMAMATALALQASAPAGAAPAEPPAPSAGPFQPRVDPQAQPMRVAVQAMRAYGCAHCHTVPGVTGARGRVGPSLAGLHERSHFAGQYPVDEDTLVRFIVAPAAMRPGTVMPMTGITEPQARAVAAWLLSPPARRRGPSAWAAWAMERLEGRDGRQAGKGTSR